MAGSGASCRSRISRPGCRLAEIVGRYVKLTRRGREHLGLCPFHKEKTPSFNVVEEKGFYHCFGCGAHGTAIDFVMAVEGLGFAERVDAAGRADRHRGAAPRGGGGARAGASGSTRPTPRRRPGSRRQLLAPAAGRRAPISSGAGSTGRSSVAFELGYAPNDRQALRAALRGQGFARGRSWSPPALLAGRGRRRGRSTASATGSCSRSPTSAAAIVGFGGRALGEARAKYLNTPETEIFHKGELLYNLHRAARPARERREVVLAEGYMDVIALAQAGIAHAVAPLGTAVTERQLAAPMASGRSADRLPGRRPRRPGGGACEPPSGRCRSCAAGQSLRFAILPDGEDPDSFLRRHGAEALRRCCPKRTPCRRSSGGWRPGASVSRRPEARAALSRRLRSLARLAADADLRGSLLDRVSRPAGGVVAPRMGRRRAEGRRSSAWKGSGRHVWRPAWPIRSSGGGPAGHPRRPAAVDAGRPGGDVRPGQFRQPVG